MGDVVALQTGDRASSHLPDLPPAESVTLSPMDVRRLARDLRHLDDMAARLRNVETLSSVIRTITGATAERADQAARTIGLYIATGDAGVALQT